MAQGSLDNFVSSSKKRGRSELKSDEKEEPVSKKPKVDKTTSNESTSKAASSSSSSSPSPAPNPKPEEIDFKNIEEALTEKGWKKMIGSEFEKSYFKDLKKFLIKDSKSNTIYPPPEKIFTALNLCAWDNLKVVIIGQDPYHGPNQAHGLSFSVEGDVKIPPSLRNMYKELSNDIPGFKIPKHGNLHTWAEQGVLMLNAVLTVREKKPNSHTKKGWEQFTSAVIQAINKHKDGVVFFLWGGNAKAKGKGINPSKHHILSGPHPSPLSASKGFFGCKHFSKCNNLLEKQGKTAIDWNSVNNQ